MRPWSPLTAWFILLTSVNSHAQPRALCGATPANSDETNLALITTLVTDRRGAPITDLNVSQFHVFEAGREQVIKFCAQEDLPASIGIVLDTSGSMGTNLELLKPAAIQFLRSGNAADEYLLVAFHDRPKILVPFTTNAEQLSMAIHNLQGGGSTALLDAIYLTVEEVERAKTARKAVVVISDGLDNHSRYTAKEVTRLVSEIDFPIYSINFHGNPGSGNRFSIQRRDPGILDTISTETGGRSFSIMNARKLASVLELAAFEIRRAYVLGYVTSDENGGTRRIHVKVDTSPGQALKVSYRQRYHTSRPGS